MPSISPQPPCRAPEVYCTSCAKLARFGGSSDASKHNLDSQKQRLQLLSDINQEHDLLSKRLPVELCAHIFYICLDDIKFLSKRKFSPRSSRGPLHLSQVCRSWRTLALSSPLLWTLMPMFVFKEDKASLQAVTEFAGEWIRRSGDILPLSIILHIIPDTDPGYCRPLFEVIGSCSPRIQDLQILASTANLRQLFSLYQRRSNLMNLRLTSFGAPPKQEMRYVSKFKPTHLFLENATPENFGIDTTNLIHFASKHMSLMDIVNLFSSAHQMTSCILDYPTFFSAFPPFLLPSQTYPPLAHSALKHLHIKESDDSLRPDFLFEAFTFPSLETLTLRLPGSDQTRVLTALINNLRRSDSHLTTLSMTNLSFTDMEDDTLFVDLIITVGTSLRHLELSTADDFHGETGIIASILGDASTRLPQLRSLKLFMNGESCVRTLHKLLSASFAIASANTEPVSFVFWTYDHMIRDDETGDIDFDVGDSLGSNDDDETHSPIAPEEIRNMVSVLRNELLSVKIIVLPDSIYYGSTEDEDPDPDATLDMTEDVIEALGFLVEDAEYE